MQSKNNYYRYNMKKELSVEEYVLKEDLIDKNVTIKEHFGISVFGNIN